MIFSRSYPLLYGSKALEPLNILGKGQENFGGLAVKVFLVISDYLICASYLKTSSLKHYLYARILRIIPGLAVVLLVSVLIIEPCVTRLSLHEYFYNRTTWGYLRSVLLYLMHLSLLVVSFSSSAFGSDING